MQKEPLNYYEYEESFWESTGLKRYCDRIGITAFWEKYWKIIASVLLLLILIGYIPLYMQKGVLFEGDFYRTEKFENGMEFGGSDYYDTFRIRVEKPDDETCNITYVLNDTTKEYKLELIDQNELLIYEDDVLYFEGTRKPSGYDDSYILIPKDEDMKDTWSVYVYTGRVSEQLSAQQIFSLYLGEEVKRGAGGHPEYMFLALIIFGIWLIDIWFPRFFFMLHHIASVKDPEPTEWYEFTQKISWVIIPIVAIVLLGMSLM